LIVIARKQQSGLKKRSGKKQFGIADFIAPHHSQKPGRAFQPVHGFICVAKWLKTDAKWRCLRNKKEYYTKKEELI